MRDWNLVAVISGLPSTSFCTLLSCKWLAEHGRGVSWIGIVMLTSLPAGEGEGGLKCRGERRGRSVPCSVPRFVEGGVGPHTVFGELRP